MCNLDLKDITFRFMNDGYLDTQFYGECQVVTAINAWIHLTGGKFSDVFPDYDHIVDVSLSRNGSALRVEKAYDHLGLKVTDEYGSFHSWAMDGAKLPAEFTVIHPRYGLHSVGCVDFIEKCMACRVCNFRYETTVGGWIFAERMETWVLDVPGYAGKKNHVKVFGLVNQP